MQDLSYLPPDGALKRNIYKLIKLYLVMGIVSGIIVLIIGLIFLIFPKAMMYIFRPKTYVYNAGVYGNKKKGFESPNQQVNKIYGEKLTIVFRVIGVILVLVSIFLFFT